MSTKTLRWGSPPTGIHNAPIYLGLDRGIFGVPGVAVEARDNISGADYTEELVAGAFDMGHIGTPPLFAALARTDDYAVVGLGMMKFPPFYLVTPPEVNSVRDLAGRAVALNKLRTCPHSIIRTLLRREGMDDSDIHLVSLVEGGPIVAAIGRGELGAAMLWEPYVSCVERVFGWKVLFAGRTAISPPNYGFALYARRSLLASEPTLVRGMIDAYAESVRAAKQDLPAAKATVQERITDVRPEDLDRAFQRDAPYWSDDTRLDTGFLMNVMGEMEIQAVIPDGFDLADYLAEAPQAV